jgi:hypothetical protein
MRVLACVPTQADVAPMLALLRAASPSPVSPLTVYLNLVPLVGLTSSVPRTFKHGDRKCVLSGGTDSERIVNAFQYICIAPYATMHDDVCAVTLEKHAMLIVVPFHQRLTIDGSIENTTASAGAIQAANINVLHYSRCSVAILIDRGSHSVVPTGLAAVDAAGLAPARPRAAQGRAPARPRTALGRARAPAMAAHASCSPATRGAGASSSPAMAARG